MDDLPRARTLGELVLYLRVRGAILLAARHSRERGRAVVRVRVRHDGEEQVWPFQLVDPNDEDLLNLGGAAPSALLDPADLVLFAARVERELPQTLDGLGKPLLRRHLRDLELAAEAVDEANKFVPRRAAAIPREAFTTAAARWLYDREPERFSRAALLALADRLRRRIVWYQAVLTYL